MQLRFFRACHGLDTSYTEFAAEARADGYDGLEADVPLDPSTRQSLRDALADFDCDFIAEIATGGGRLPDRRATPAQHHDDFIRQLEVAAELAPLRINCLAGCDAWPLAQSRDFLGLLIERARQLGIPISFETCRGRSLFTPWITRELVRALPELHLTGDFSHWCVVCERLVDSEQEVLEEIAPRVRHLHARIGNAQGTQVAHPAAPEHAAALLAHQRWWALCWQATAQAGLREFTMTPEFEPLPRQRTPRFEELKIMPRDLNRWMLRTEHAHFARWLAQR
ncbi:MAG: Xylose isomerase domain protein barrel [Moraxellaceae bacterium]|nr:Xylose isomerase domain protein barrel [Moraxellaceae bacterium]